MTKTKFLQEHRQVIRDHIAKEHGENTRPTNDEETWDWVMNDESLYLWAKSQGIKV